MLPVDRDALTAAMALVPGMFSRNRSFALYTNPDVKRARTRAAVLRSAVRQLGAARSDLTTLELLPIHGSRDFELRYRISGLHLDRRIILSAVESACLCYLASKAGIHHLPSTDADRMLIDNALKRLSAGLAIDSLSPRLVDLETRAKAVSSPNHGLPILQDHRGPDPVSDHPRK